MKDPIWIPISPMMIEFKPQITIEPIGKDKLKVLFTITTDVGGRKATFNDGEDMLIDDFHNNLEKIIVRMSNIQSGMIGFIKYKKAQS